MRYCRGPGRTISLLALAVLAVTLRAMRVAQADIEPGTQPETAVAAPATPPPEKPTGTTINGLLSTWHNWFPGSSEDVEKTGERNDDPHDAPRNDANDERGAHPAVIESDAADALRAGDLLSDEERKLALPWRPPEFSGQAGALGWSEKVFEVPKALETRVNFWRDIYTKYTSDQGVLHDNIHLGIVYEQIDFTSIMADTTKSFRQKARLRERLVNERRALIIQRLKALDGRRSPDGLVGDDLRLWRLFERLKDPDKFKDAADKSRVRFQLGQRDRFLIGIYHSGRYLQEMEKIFREEKLPLELTRLPFVESSFNIRARSRIGASGIWQFMRRTARSYMKVNRDIDERNDPLRSTRASARLLRENFQMLRSWPLAITAYNHGANGMRRIVAKTGTTDISQIVNTYSSRSFGFASENFYACFLAALEAERNAPKYFREVKWGPPIDATEIRLSRPFPFKTLVEFFDGDANQAELSNPHVLGRVRHGNSQVPSGSYVRIPKLRKILAESFVQGRVPAAKLATALKETPLRPRVEVAPRVTPVVPAASVKPASASLPQPRPEPVAPLQEPGEISSPVESMPPAPASESGVGERASLPSKD